MARVCGVTWVDTDVVVLLEPERDHLVGAVEGTGQLVEGLARQIHVAVQVHTHTAAGTKKKDD